MPTRKIACPDFFVPCRSADHDPPTMMHFEPGTYEHECSSCHKKVVFIVGGTYCSEVIPTWTTVIWPKTYKMIL